MGAPEVVAAGGACINTVKAMDALQPLVDCHGPALLAMAGIFGVSLCHSEDFGSLL
ncbi:MAG: hypothetical protein LBP52_05795 [Burkholderiaceae bacterium]|jgi:hypothetical protein|nr:hypothetical protein [Burkholderiaceae bacterium]